MSHFSAALKCILEEHAEAFGIRRGVQSLFSKQSGVEPASLSRYLHDDTRPDVEALNRLCAAANPHQRAALVIAYLRDNIPPSAAELVAAISVLESPDAKQHVDSSPYQRLPRKLRKAFDKLAREAEHCPFVADAILSTAALIQGREIV